MRRTHDTHAVFRDVHEDLVQLDILLRTCADEVVIRHAGNGEYRLTVQFCVVQTIEQMKSTRPGGREADTEAAREFRVPARHERCGLFMADLYEPDLLLFLAKRLHDAVDTVARQPEYGVNAPVLENVDQDFCRSLCHGDSPSVHVCVE